MLRDIENEFKELAKDLELDEICVDDLSQEDIKMWGYDSWEEFWESNM